MVETKIEILSLKQKRMNMKMTQKQVANQAGIERSYYTKIENGFIPSVKIAKQLSLFFQIEWTFFYTIEK